MRQVVQPLSGGSVRVVDVPRPVIGPAEVLVQTVSSVISPGTERAVTELAQSSLLAKSRARPDLVRQVLRKARTDGVSQTIRTVRARLDDYLPLGYSAAGIALEVGEAVGGISPGQLVATGGAGKANHAEFQSVPGLLCSAVPDGTEPEEAAFATIASIALHGLRLAELGPGSKVVVIGLGLLGQLATRLAQAAGCDVAGIDVAEAPVARARASGAFALVEAGDDTTKEILEWSRGRGADAVLLTAGSRSSDTVMRTPPICRDRASVVVVGDVGLELERTPFYEKELALRFARSYGPGRYERSYEDWAVDYPPGFVRWTEGRNAEAVLDLMALGRLEVAGLVTHRFSVDDAPSAYQLIASGQEDHAGVVLSYPARPSADQPVRLAPRRPAEGSGIGFVGAGAFASAVLVPAFTGVGLGPLVAVASGSGLSARRLAEQARFQKAVSTADEVIEDPDVGVVVIATPHDTHAALAARALRSGKHVFCEKPLALTIDELADVEAAWADSGRVLFVGFNRRWSEPVTSVRRHLDGHTGRLVITYRVSAGLSPDGHWYGDRRQGGRLVGEMCHFVDTCSAIVGAPAGEVVALANSSAERLLADDVVLNLSYPDGSLASVSYASGGHWTTPKERIEVLGRGRSAVIDDFRSVNLDGKPAPLRRADKGHEACVRDFAREIHSTTSEVTSSLIASMRATLRAASSLRGL